MSPIVQFIIDLCPRHVSRPRRASSRSRTCFATASSSTVTTGLINFSSLMLRRIYSSAELSLESLNSFHCSKLHPHLQPLHRRCKFVLLFPLPLLQLPFPLALCASAIEHSSSLLAQVIFVLFIQNKPHIRSNRIREPLEQLRMLANL